MPSVVLITGRNAKRLTEPEGRFRRGRFAGWAVAKESFFFGQDELTSRKHTLFTQTILPPRKENPLKNLMQRKIARYSSSLDLVARRPSKK